MTVRLVIAQFLYLAMGISLLQRGFKAPGNTPPKELFTTAVLAVGLLSVIGSFPFVRSLSKQQPAGTDFETIRDPIQKQFFIGFALSEVAAIGGLLIFFLYADLKTLFFLICVASVAIVAHYLRVKKVLEDLEPGQR